jgi:DNA primase
MISKQVIDEIREKADMVKFLEDHGVTLQVSGANYKGLCPYHNERSPSFNVRPGIQRFHCFGCSETGDIFDLVAHMEQLSFGGAIQYLAEEMGIKITSDEEDEQYKKVRRLQQICKLASEFFHENFKNLPQSHPAKKNLADRNLLEFAETDPSIGYAPNGALLKLLHENRFSTEEIIEAGLAKQIQVEGNENTNRIGSIRNGEVKEVFRNRLMWTIYDVSGKPVGFSGRIIYENDTLSPKYVNSPQTPLYNKSKALLGLNFARKDIVALRHLFIVEGQTDVMALQAAGIRNVVASCGTAFGRSHVEILERLAATSTRKSEQFKFYFCFDGDDAGIKAAVKVFNNIPEIQLNSYVISLKTPESGDEILDPCDLRLTYGDEALRKALKAPVSMVEFVLKQELKNWDVLTPEGRSGFVTACRPTLALIKDPLAHDSYLRKISFWSGVPYSQLITHVRPNGQAQQQAQAPQTLQGGTGASLSIDEQMYAAFLQYPERMWSLYYETGIEDSFFANPAEIQHIMDELPEDHPLMFADLKISEGKEDALLKRLCELFLRIKYMEAVDQLNGRIAAASNDSNSLMDETLLIEIMGEQAALKEKYRQK